MNKRQLEQTQRAIARMKAHIAEIRDARRECGHRTCAVCKFNIKCARAMLKAIALLERQIG